MDPAKRRTLLFLTAIALGFSLPYLINMAGQALEQQAETAALVPLDELSSTQRLERACAAIQQLNNKLNRLDPNRPSFLSEFRQYGKIHPELQDLKRLVCET